MRRIDEQVSLGGRLQEALNAQDSAAIRDSVVQADSAAADSASAADSAAQVDSLAGMDSLAGFPDSIGSIALPEQVTELVDGPVLEALERVNDVLAFPIPVLSGIGSAESVIDVGSVIGFFIAIALTFTISKFVQGMIARGLRSRGIEDLGTIGTTQRLVHYVLVVIGMGVAIEILGFDLTALFAAGAVVAVGIGFALQNILQNFVSGFILLIERTIKPNDVIEVDGRVVKVEEMGIRATIVRTWDDDQVIIPNAALVQNNVTNYTLRDNLYRLRCKVGVTYSSDMDQVADVLSQACRAVDGRTLAKDPVILMTEFGDSAVLFDASIWIENPWTARANRSHLYFSVWHHLREAGITIAFPQMDLHFDDPPWTKPAGERGSEEGDGREAGAGEASSDDARRPSSSRGAGEREADSAQRSAEEVAEKVERRNAEKDEEGRAGG